MLGRDNLGAGIKDHKAAGPVGVFGLAGTKAGLSNRGRLLIAQIATDRYLPAEGTVGQGVTVEVWIAGGPNFRQHSLGDVHRPQNFIIPGRAL